MKSFKNHINEATVDDRKEVAKQLKKFAKKYVSGPVSVTSGKGKFPYVQLRARSGEISNELRKMVIDKAFPKANIKNMDDISYGNVTKNYIAVGAGDWKKVMGLKESTEQIDEYLRKDVYAVLDLKGKTVAAGLTKKNAHKLASDMGGHKKTTIVLNPDAKVGDVEKKFTRKK